MSGRARRWQRVNAMDGTVKIDDIYAKKAYHGAAESSPCRAFPSSDSDTDEVG